jgi:KDO2-lipid IV(A) lauroyltransferase
MTDEKSSPQVRPSTSLSHRLEYAAFCSIRWIFERFTVPQAASLSAFFWRLIAPHLRRHKRAISNLKAALPELNNKDRKQLLTRMWDNLGRTSAEALRLNVIADDPNSLTLNFSADSLAIMHRATPAIFVSLHYGNWEVTALAAERFNKPLLGIYKRVVNPLVDRDVTKLRSRFYKGGFVSKGPDAVRSVIRAIKAGYSIAVMADLRESNGDLVPFFGIPSPSTTFPAMMARLYDLPIVAIRATRTAPGHFLIEAETISLAQTADRKADILENTARIQVNLEHWIKDDPALWMWGHRRWGQESFPPKN